MREARLLESVKVRFGKKLREFSLVKQTWNNKEILNVTQRIALKMNIILIKVLDSVQNKLFEIRTDAQFAWLWSMQRNVCLRFFLQKLHAL